MGHLPAIYHMVSNSFSERARERERVLWSHLCLWKWWLWWVHDPLHFQKRADFTPSLSCFGPVQVYGRGTWTNWLVYWGHIVLVFAQNSNQTMPNTVFFYVVLFIFWVPYLINESSNRFKFTSTQQETIKFTIGQIYQWSRRFLLLQVSARCHALTTPVTPWGWFIFLTQNRRFKC